MRFRRTEDELLVLLAQLTTDPDHRAAVETLARGNVDWAYLLEKADAQDVLPAVYTNLREYCPACLDQPDVKRYEAVYSGYVLHNMRLTAELVNVVKLLRARDIPAIPLKGPVIAQLVYGDIRLRMFSDLDILVAEGQFEQAKQVLMENGYALSERELRRNRAKSGRRPHEYTLVKSEWIFLELHWALEPLWYATHKDTEAFWQSTRPTPCFGTTLILPGNEDMLLYLCRHGSRHLWSRLKWLCDIALYLQVYPALDWDYVLRRAESSQSKSLLLIALSLSAQVFDTALPPIIAQAIEQDTKVEQGAAQILERMFTEAPPASRSESVAEAFVMRFQLRDGWLTRLRFSYALIKQRLKPNATDQAVIDLPPRLSGLYYPIRFFRLVRIYGMTLIRRWGAPEKGKPQAGQEVGSEAPDQHKVEP